MSLGGYAQSFAFGAGAAIAFGVGINGGFGDTVVVGAGAAKALVAGVCLVGGIVGGIVGANNDPNPLSFRAGLVSGAVGVALAFHLAATNAPKAPDVPVNDNSATTQQQSGKALSCEDIAKKCGLELK
jgi:hypothetical protein